MESHASQNDPKKHPKHAFRIKKDSADFLSIDTRANEHGAFKGSAISCPQRCTHFFGTSEIGQIIRKPSAIGLRHMPALRVGILMRSWSSSAALLIKVKIFNHSQHH
jgi:hypothetical protein